MAWPLIAVGAALMVGSAAGASAEEGGDVLNLTYPAPSQEEKLANDTLAQLATQLYEESGKVNPELYRDIFETLPETKMSDEARARLTKAYKEVNILADSKAMERAGMAFGKKIDDLVASGAMSATQGDTQKLQNEARVRAMMSTLSKRWQATEIADARKMWVGEQKSDAKTAGALAQVKAKNQYFMNAAIDQGLKYSLKRAGMMQDFTQKQMWANEKVLQEARQAEYDFWGKMIFPGQGGSTGSNWQNPNMNAGGGGGLYSQYSSNPGAVDSFYRSGYGSGMWNSSGAGWGSYSGGGLGGGYA